MFERENASESVNKVLKMWSRIVLTETLPQSGFLHLFPHKIVPAVAPLPHQADLVAEDRQVAYEADRRHCPEMENQSTISLTREFVEFANSNWVQLTQSFSTTEFYIR